jgi:hypothetical protein
MSAACVVIDDPDHCANRDGDATCVEENDVGWMCSSCTRGNHGCVMSPPPEGCHDTAADMESTAGPTSSEGDDDTDATAETGTDCEPGCEGAAPYCIDMQCVSCGDAGGDAFCDAIDPALPQCHPGTGLCVACYADPSPACVAPDAFCDDAFECGGCTEHAQCPDSACDLETGQCMDDATQLWVDNQTCVEPAMGTEESPYCSITDAVAVIGAGDTQSVIHVLGGMPYSDVIAWTDCASDRTLAVLGSGGVVTLQGDPNVADVTCGNTLYLSRLRLITGQAAGVHCDAARVWIDESTLYQNEIGVDAVGCRAHVRRSQILQTTSIGIRTDDESDLWLSSSIIGSGGDPKTTSRAILATTGTVDIRFSTIANNLGSSEPSFWCSGNTTGAVRNSIFGAPGGSSVDCPTVDFFTSALDDAAMATDGNVHVLYQGDWFADPAEDDYHLGAGTVPDGYLEGGVWQPGDPRVDIDRDARTDTPGAVVSIGADAR